MAVCDTDDKHMYAALDFHDDDDEVAKERTGRELKKEMSKHNPKTTVVKELIKRSIKTRRDAVLKCDRSVAIMLEEFPHLRKFSFVSRYWAWTCI